MANGTITGSTNNQYISSKLVWSATTNVAGNYSLVSATLYYSRTNTGYTTSGTWNGSITINGVKTEGSKSVSITYNSNTVAMSVKDIKVSHNANGSKSITISASGGISGTSFTSTSLSKSVALDTIPRKATITSAPNFNDEQNPTIGYSNAAGNSVSTLQVGIYSVDAKTAFAAYRDVSKTGTSYTFSLTTAERQALQKACVNANSMTVRFYIKTIISGTTFTHYVEKTLTIKDGGVTLSPTVVDTNATTIALTGNNQTLIKYYSNAQFNTGETLRKFATNKERSVVCGAKSATTTTGTFNNVESGVFSFITEDSRGNTAAVSITKTMINYIKLTSNLVAKASLVGENQTAIKIDVSGNYFSGSFGAASNTLTVQYRYKTENGSYGSWTNITATASGGKYTASTTISGLDYTKDYTVQARAIDKIATGGVNTQEIVVRTKPVFDWSGEDFNFNVPVKFNGDEWHNLTYTSNFQNYGTSGNDTPKYKVCGNVVSIRGIFTPKTAVATDSTPIIFATGLPSEYCPPISICQICQGTGMNKWLLEITPNGTLTISRYGTTAFSTISPGNWLPFNATYMI